MNWQGIGLGIIPLIAGTGSGLLARVGSWYRQLDKPSWTPPDWVFGPAWTILYILMGVSLYLLWTRKAPSWVLWLFGLQLLLNFIWSPVFFRFHEIGWALMLIIMLDVVVLALIISSWSVSRWASYLLVPYLLWIIFATALNASILLRN